MSAWGFLIFSLRRRPPAASASAATAASGPLPSVLDDKIDAPPRPPVEEKDWRDNAEGRVWFARFFTAEGNDKNSTPRREAIAARVREEFDLHTLGLGRGRGDGDDDDDGFGSDEEDAMKDPFRDQAHGMVPLEPGRLMRTAKVVVWQQFMGAAFAVVCDEDDCNVMLCRHFLCVFISAVVEHFGNFKVLQSAVQIYQRPEELGVLTDKFLPNGQLGYIHGPLVRKLLDEVRALLQMKPVKFSTN